MLAFIRGSNSFFGAGDLYVKMLPDGEPVQLTHDGKDKLGPAFSPVSSVRAVKAITRPLSLAMGNITRLRKRS